MSNTILCSQILRNKRYINKQQKYVNIREGIKMQKTDELKVKARHLRNKRDEMEEQMREITRMQEEEEYNMMHSYRKLEETWHDYGEDVPELESLLEEERSILDKYRVKMAEYDEQLRNEFRKEMSNLDTELDEVQKQIVQAEDIEEGGEQ